MTSEDFIGSIYAFGGTFAPVDYAYCGGGVLAIAQNTVLYAIIGTNFGGDGRVTLGVPDLRSRALLGAGSGPGLDQRYTGYFYGTEETSAAMDDISMPAHTHSGSFSASDLNSAVQSSVQSGSTVVSGTLSCEALANGQNSPAGAYPASTANAALNIWSTSHNTTTTAAIPVASPQIASLPMQTTLLTDTIPATVTATGSGDPFIMTQMQPSTVCMYVMAIEGLFPPRS